MTGTKTLAVPHTRQAGPSPGAPATKRVGGLAWWTFHACAADLAAMAEAATRAKLPQLFLPLPHPVTPQVAFNRMIRAGARVLDGARWQAQLWSREEAAGQWVPKQVRRWLVEAAGGAALVAGSVRWEPQRLEEPHAAAGARGASRQHRPFHTRLWIRLSLAPDAPALPTMELVEFRLMVRPLGRRVDQAVDVTDHIVKIAADPENEKAFEAEASSVYRRLAKLELRPGERRIARESLRMGALLFNALDRERMLATSPEIGDGIKDALESMGGVSLGPGLFVVPGDDGVTRAEQSLAYLKPVEGATGDMLDLYTKGGASRLADLVRPLLEKRILALEEDILAVQVELVGIGLLRTLKRRLEAEAELLAHNGIVLGPTNLKKLKALLRRAVKSFEAKVAEKRRQAKREIVLDAVPPEQALRDLVPRLDAFLALARKGSVGDLELALPQLKSGLQSLPGRTWALLLRRLAKLGEAVVHASRSVANQRRDERTRVLFKALERATFDLRKRCLAAIR